jgi:hypothetical protein
MSDCVPCVPVNTPGPQGLPGVNGSNGVNAFTTLTANFNSTTVGTTINGVQVVNNQWLAPGQYIWITNAANTVAGLFTVLNVYTNGTQVDIIPQYYQGGTQPVTPFTAGSYVVASGQNGAYSFTAVAAGGGAPYTTPAIGSTVTPTLNNVLWLAKGQYVFIANIGIFQVGTITITSSPVGTAVLTALYYIAGVTAGTTTFTTGAAVSPSGTVATGPVPASSTVFSSTFAVPITTPGTIANGGNTVSTITTAFGGIAVQWFVTGFVKLTFGSTYTAGATTTYFLSIYRSSPSAATIATVSLLDGTVVDQGGGYVHGEITIPIQCLYNTSAASSLDTLVFQIYYTGALGAGSAPNVTYATIYAVPLW